MTPLETIITLVKDNAGFLFIGICILIGAYWIRSKLGDTL